MNPVAFKGHNVVAGKSQEEFHGLPVMVGQNFHTHCWEMDAPEFLHFLNNRKVWIQLLTPYIIPITVTAYAPEYVVNAGHIEYHPASDKKINWDEYIVAGQDGILIIEHLILKPETETGVDEGNQVVRSIVTSNLEIINSFLNADKYVDYSALFDLYKSGAITRESLFDKVEKLENNKVFGNIELKQGDIRLFDIVRKKYVIINLDNIVKVI